MEDKRNILRDDKPFSFRLIGSEKAQVLYKGKPVFVAAGKDFERLRAAAEGGDEYRLQMAMAKMTGNFKRGNER